MKLRSPKGCGAISHQGRILEISEDGSIDVDEDIWASLGAHGFKLWSDEAPPEIDEMTRDELVMGVTKLTLETMLSMGSDEICSKLVGAQNANGSQESGEPALKIEMDRVRLETLSTLNRPALFSFLKSKGVSVSLPVTNAELRTLAARALSG